MASPQETKKKGDRQHKEEEEGKRASMSPQEIGEYRAEAQQNSIESIRAAEERYNRAKQAGGSALQGTREAGAHGLGATSAYLAATKDAGLVKGQKGYEVGKDYVQKAGVKAKEDAAAAGETAVEYAKEVAVKAKDASLSAGATAADYAKQGAVKAKDVGLSTGETALDYAKHGAVKAKDVTMSTGETVADYAKQGAVKAKEIALSTGETALDYAKQGAVKAKDVTMSTGEAAVDYAKQGAVKAKDATIGAAKTAADTSQEAKDTASERTSEKYDQSKRKVGKQIHEAEEKQERPGKDLKEEELVTLVTPTVTDKERSSKTAVGELCEHVGEAVTGMAKTAKEMAVGKEEPEKKE